MGERWGRTDDERRRQRCDPEGCGRVSGRNDLRPTLSSGTPYNYEILSVDVTGDIAVVKVVDDCFGTTFTDCLTLIKHDDRWQIVMKAFFDHANA